MKPLYNIAVLMCWFAGGTLSVRAQAAVPPPMPAYQPLSDAQLDQLLGPIALYPDPLIAEILPASTLPAQIVLADRYVSGGGDPNQLDQQPWDASVEALAHYPTVLNWMDDNLNWTTELGQAFLNQQPEVMESIQRLRMTAANFGNLQSTPQQQVITDDGFIEIVPVDPQVIYVPVYQPSQVYSEIAGSSPFILFGSGWPVGAWLNCDFDWGNHNIIIWGRGHPRPAGWWHEGSHQRGPGPTTVWRPGNHPGTLAANRGDRGWNINPVVRSAAPIVTRSEPARQAPPRDQRPISIHQAAPPVVEHAAPVSWPELNGAFIGIHSSDDTKSYSNRGQQSMQTITHSEPVSRPAPSFSGGGNSSNSQKKH